MMLSIHKSAIFKVHNPHTHPSRQSRSSRRNDICLCENEKQCGVFVLTVLSRGLAENGLLRPRKGTDIAFVKYTLGEYNSDWLTTVMSFLLIETARNGVVKGQAYYIRNAQRSFLMVYLPRQCQHLTQFYTFSRAVNRETLNMKTCTNKSNTRIRRA